MKHAILIFLMAAGVALVASTPAEAQYDRKCLSRSGAYDSLAFTVPDSTGALIVFPGRTGFYDVTCDGRFGPGKVKVRIWSATKDTVMVRTRRIWRNRPSIDSLIVREYVNQPGRSASLVAVDTAGFIYLNSEVGTSIYTAEFTTPYMLRDFELVRRSGVLSTVWYYDMLIEDK